MQKDNENELKELAAAALTMLALVAFCLITLFTFNS